MFRLLLSTNSSTKTFFLRKMKWNCLFSPRQALELWAALKMWVDIGQWKLVLNNQEYSSQLRTLYLVELFLTYPVYVVLCLMTVRNTSSVQPTRLDRQLIQILLNLGPVKSKLLWLKHNKSNVWDGQVIEETGFTSLPRLCRRDAMILSHIFCSLVKNQALCLRLLKN